MPGNNNFIEEYTISDKACDRVVNFFYINEDMAEPGKQGEPYPSVDTSVKDSKDLVFSIYDNIPHVQGYLEELLSCVKEYIDRVVKLEGECIIASMRIYKNVSIQKYEPGGGFHSLHFERASLEVSHRELAFMTYLTNTPNAGTSFPQWNYESECAKGKTLIWPASFTHAHKGIVSNEHEKMIITGWVEWAQLPY